MSGGALIILNPNSSDVVSAGIDAAVEPLRAFGRRIETRTNSAGPPGIESQEQAERVIPQLLDMVDETSANAAGYVVACFGDPGLHALRDRTALPVLGIQESAVSVAMTLGHRIGVIAILPGSIPRHLRSFGAMGVAGRIVGDRALDLGVADLSDPDRTLARMIDVGRDLQERDGADVLIMGCAGMARYRAPLEAALRAPVVEPCQAAVGLALTHIALNQKHKIGGPDA